MKTKKSSFERFYGDLDPSPFRNGLDVEKAKQLIFWSVGGYAGRLLEEFQSFETSEFDFEKIRVEFDGYLKELRKAFYK